MDHRFIEFITYSYNDETKDKILQNYEQKETLLDVDLFQEHLMVQPVLAVIILSLILASFLILLFSIVFIGCRALGKCGAKRYQPHPTNGRRYSAYLVIFLCSWFLMATASSYYAYCGTHLWSLRSLEISKPEHIVKKRSADEQSVFDLFDNPDYQGDFEQLESSTPSLAFVTDKVEKSVRPRFPLHRFPHVDDSSEDSPPAVEQLPIFPINFTSRVPLASTIISPIEIPARPKAELDFRRLLDGEKLVTSSFEERQGEHMSGAFVGDGLPRARNLISSPFKQPMSSLGSPMSGRFSSKKDSSENPILKSLNGEPAEVLVETDKQALEKIPAMHEDNSVESSTNDIEKIVLESNDEKVEPFSDSIAQEGLDLPAMTIEGETSMESTTIIPERNLSEANPKNLEDVLAINSIDNLSGMSVQSENTLETTTAEVFILSMNDDEPETTTITRDTSLTTNDSQSSNELVEVKETEGDAQGFDNISSSTTISSYSPTSDDPLENTTTQDPELILIKEETTFVPSSESTTLPSSRSNEVLSTSRLIETSTSVVSEQSEILTSPKNSSASRIENNVQQILDDETTATWFSQQNESELLATSEVMKAAVASTTTQTLTNFDVTNTSIASVMTESTNETLTTDREAAVETKDLSSEPSSNDLNNNILPDFEPKTSEESEGRFENKTEEEEDVKITSTASPKITVLSTKSEPRRPTTVHTFPHTPLDETERKSITELLASPTLHPFHPLNTGAVVWIHRITFIILSCLVSFILPCSLVLILVGTICYIRSYHPMDRSRVSEKIGQLTVLLAVLFLFSLPVFILYVTMVLSYNHVYNAICPDIQLQYQQHLGLLVGSSLNTLSSNSHRLIANNENCVRSQEPILGLWISAAVFLLSSLPFIFSLFKLSKYYLRMKTEYYWTIADYGTIYAKRALHTDAIYGNIYGTLRSKRPSARPPPAPNDENAIYGESPVYGTYSAFGHM